MKFNTIKISRLSLLLGLGFLSYSTAFSQSDSNFELLFKQRHVKVKESEFRLPSQAQRLSEETSSYKLVQFYELPSDALKTNLEQRGLQLLNYVPNNAYFAFIKPNFSVAQSELASYKIRAIIDIPADVKLDKSLTLGTYPAWCEKTPGKLDLVVIFFENYSSAEASVTLQNKGAEILGEGPMAGSIIIRLPKERLSELTNIPQVQYIEPVEEEHVSENYTSRTLARSTTINSNLKGGKKYNGTGVTVSMGDSGDTGWHIDFTGRVTRMTTTYSDHSSHVCGIIGGAGNLDPKMEGLASGSKILSYSQYNDITAIPTIYSSQGVRITTHSLGTSSTCAGDYNSAAVTADQQSNTYSALLHCFSAGNSGTSTCSAYAPYSTITGGSKSGKNVITVGNLSETDGISSSSSRGPTLDGRIKPDVCAKGSNVYSTQDANLYASKSGTSMATPAVAGVLAQLYQSYRALNSGQDPAGALMKSVLLNSSEDLGTLGPDFTYGFGRVNALKAYNLLEKKQYQSNALANGATNTHTIAVPAGVGQLKVMLYWSDKAATAGVAKALVNDLDMTMAAPGGQTYQPWVLDATLNTTTLPNAATQGADHLNNVEQITIDNPASGNYTVSVKGYQIPSGTQSYYVVYEYVKDEIVVTHPIGGEMLVPGETELIRWDAYGTTGTFTVEYSTDGQTWTTLSSSVAGTRRYYSWTVPTTATAKARIRVSRSTQTDISDAAFCVLNTPKNLAIASVCSTFTRLSWSAVTGASSYEVSKLGATVMDSVGTTTNLFFDIPTVLTNEEWLSVRAVFADGTKGRRAIAISRAASPTLSCTVNALPTVYLTSPASNTTFTAQATVTIAATATDVDGSISKVEFYNGATLLGSDATSPYTYSWTGVAAGTYTITAKATDNSGAITTSTAVSITVNPATNVAPTVSITAPTTGATYTAPATVPITANAADADGSIAKVEFYNGTTLLGSDATSPYAYSWTSVAAGTYSITAKATDNSGAVTTSTAVSITVNPANVAPTVSITAPTTGATYTAPATVAITANVADADGSIAKVEFYNGTTLLGSDATSPYAYSWTSVAAGTYSITAKATDNSGAVTTSTVVSITVNPAQTGTEDCSNIAPWNSTSIYVNGDFVTYENIKYKAKWWTKGNNPATTSGQYDVWQKLGECISGSVNAAVTDITMTPENATTLTTNQPLAINVSGLSNGTVSEVNYFIYKDTIRIASITKKGIDFSTEWQSALTGNYLLQVVVKDANGKLIYSAAKEIAVSQTTGVSTNTFNTEINLYPNPTTGLVNLSQAAKSVTVFDLSGKVLDHKNEVSANIDLSLYAAGTYILQIESDADTSFHKVTKE